MELLPMDVFREASRLAKGRQVFARPTSTPTLGYDSFLILLSFGLQNAVQGGHACSREQHETASSRG
jgi:hypothetical protein